MITASSQEILLVEQRGPVAWLTLNRPSKNNALSVELNEALLGACRLLPLDVAVVVLRGEGKHFCVGSDLKDLYQVDRAEAERVTIALSWRPAMRFAALPQLTVRDHPWQMFWRRRDSPPLLRFAHRSSGCRVCPPRGKPGLGSSLWDRTAAGQRAAPFCPGHASHRPRLRRPRRGAGARDGSTGLAGAGRGTCPCSRKAGADSPTAPCDDTLALAHRQEPEGNPGIR